MKVKKRNLKKEVIKEGLDILGLILMLSVFASIYIILAI